MATPDTVQLAEVVKELATSTASGEIQWLKVNPTTYSWSSESGRVVVQKIVPSARAAQVLAGASTVRYHLEAFDSSGATQLSVSSNRSPETGAALQSLFTAITSSMTAKGVDFLRQLVAKGGGSAGHGDGSGM